MRIAIAGKMASGKTTLAKYIESKYGCTRMAIADKLKEIATLHAEEMLNKPEELAKGLTAHVVDLLPEADVITFGRAIATLAGIFYTCETVSGKNRNLLQRIGHDMHLFGDDIWITYLIENRLPGVDDVVIDDVRYPVELDLLRQEGFVLVRIEVSPNEQSRRLHNLYGYVDEKELNHPSETLLDEARYTIVIESTADKGIDAMCREFDEAYENLLKLGGAA